MNIDNLPGLAALLVTAILTALGLVHVYWALGGRVGWATAVPEVDGRRAFTPSRAATLVVAGCLLAAAGVVAVAGRLIGDSLAPMARLPAFGLALVFAARAIGDFRLVGFFKRVRGSRFARLDTVLYAPLCLGLAIAIGCVACGVARG